MIYVKPDFYDDFKCIASDCKHSCCVGWEIDIDDAALAIYESLDGEIGDMLRRNIEYEPSPHFRLGENERCPMLNCDGLCRLIISEGEEKLCDICAEHPRFYNCYNTREEMGLGLCCEEAVRLLFEGNGHLEFHISGEGEETGEFSIRDKVFEILRDDEKSLMLRMENALKLCGAKIPALDVKKWAEFYLSLERLDEAWTDKLRTLLKAEDIELENYLNKTRYVRLLEYFVYRHFLSEDWDADSGEMLAFCVLSVCMICVLDAVFGEDTENVRLYSSEIEYSDENIGLIIGQIQ